MSDDHTLAASQFGPRAHAYVTSAVHAAGEDLDALRAFAAAKAFDRVLDLGCGGGHVSFALAPLAGSVTAYDLSDAMLTAVSAEAAARGLTNITTRQGKAEALPFDSASADFIATRYSAHHWLDVPRALQEMHRVLKPGGALMVMDCVAPDDVRADTFIQSIEMLRDPSHVRDYGVAEWVAMLAAAGFSVRETVRRRIHIGFESWIARMQTPPVQAAAIQALTGAMPPAVREYFAVETDGSFMLDTASFLATA
jgi:Methylase involved in ubiquinone/menaquinone biosynthesis